MQVKICGITQAAQAVAIAEAGATALGFICVERSPRYVEPGAIATMTAHLQAQDQPVNTIGVFADNDLATIAAVVSQGQLSGVQLHGRESPQFCQQLRARLPQVSVIKALRIRTPEDLLQAHRYEPTVDTLLLDAYHPQQLGGTGQTLDWSQLQSFHPGCPWLLAGGLTPANVATALAQIAPDGIDLSSGVEAAPGIKDMEKVAQLFAALRVATVQ